MRTSSDTKAERSFDSLRSLRTRILIGCSAERSFDSLRSLRTRILIGCSVFSGRRRREVLSRYRRNPQGQALREQEAGREEQSGTPVLAAEAGGKERIRGWRF